MKIFLDDCRPTPNGWVRTYTPKGTIELLKCNEVEELSLDHDLGDDDGIGTGYDVLLWIEERVLLHRFVPPSSIVVHSSNSSAVEKMNAAICNIYKIKSDILNNKKDLPHVGVDLDRDDYEV